MFRSFTIVKPIPDPWLGMQFYINQFEETLKDYVFVCPSPIGWNIILFIRKWNMQNISWLVWVGQLLFGNLYHIWTTISPISDQFLLTDKLDHCHFGLVILACYLSSDTFGHVFIFTLYQARTWRRK